MLRNVRIAFARRAVERATVAYVADQNQPATSAWRISIADLLHRTLIMRERKLSQLING